MRFLAIALTPLLLLSGCIADSPAAVPTINAAAHHDASEGQPTPAAAPPEDIEHTSALIYGLEDPTGVGFGLCEAPTSGCDRFPFTAQAAVSVSAVLTLDTTLHEADLYLVDADGEALLSLGTDVLDVLTNIYETGDVTLAPGDYEFLVVPNGVASYWFSATFSAA